MKTKFFYVQWYCVLRFEVPQIKISGIFVFVIANLWLRRWVSCISDEINKKFNGASFKSIRTYSQITSDSLILLVTRLLKNKNPYSYFLTGQFETQHPLNLNPPTVKGSKCNHHWKILYFKVGVIRKKGIRRESAFLFSCQIWKSRLIPF